jgi:hypothetical protein
VQPNLKRPVIPANFGSKVPSNIRQRYLNLIIDECLKFLDEEQAYKKVFTHHIASTIMDIKVWVTLTHSLPSKLRTTYSYAQVKFEKN